MLILIPRNQFTLKTLILILIMQTLYEDKILTLHLEWPPHRKKTLEL